MTGGIASSEPSVHPPGLAVEEAVRRALAEDVLPSGDLTASLLPEGVYAQAAIVSRQPGVLAGTRCATEAFAQVDAEVKLDWAFDDGDGVEKGSAIASVEGPLRSILTAERTSLNFLGHLSGIATLTGRYVEAVRKVNPRTAVWDTRKTTPGLRALEKAAVRAGGGRNHRASLSEGVLIKDNHLSSLSVDDAVKRALEAWPGRLVEVECETADQVAEAVSAGAPVVMLDNMAPELVARCVTLVRERRGSVLVEVSGGVTLESAPRYAAAGADLISVGALTHSAPSLDLGLDLKG